MDNAKTDAEKARAIIDFLIATSDDRIWASELRFNGGNSRADFWTLEPVASKGFRATAYEVKVSRADFKRDNEAKQSDALRWSDRFWYITPPALIAKYEVPAWAGLMEWDGKSLAVIKRAPSRRKSEPNWDLVVSILRCTAERGRDISLLKAQLAFYHHRDSERDRRDRINNQFRTDRWLAKMQPSSESA